MRTSLNIHEIVIQGNWQGLGHSSSIGVGTKYDCYREMPEGKYLSISRFEPKSGGQLVYRYIRSIHIKYNHEDINKARKGGGLVITLDILGQSLSIQEVYILFEWMLNQLKDVDNYPLISKDETTLINGAKKSSRNLNLEELLKGWADSFKKQIDEKTQKSKSKNWIYDYESEQTPKITTGQEGILLELLNDKLSLEIEDKELSKVDQNYFNKQHTIQADNSPEGNQNEEAENQQSSEGVKTPNPSKKEEITSQEKNNKEQTEKLEKAAKHTWNIITFVSKVAGISIIYPFIFLILFLACGFGLGGMYAEDIIQLFENQVVVEDEGNEEKPSLFLENKKKKGSYQLITKGFVDKLLLLSKKQDTTTENSGKIIKISKDSLITLIAKEWLKSPEAEIHTIQQIKKINKKFYDKDDKKTKKDSVRVSDTLAVILTDNFPITREYKK